MSKKFLIALIFSGHAYAAAPSIAIEAGLPKSRPLCPFLDNNITVTYTDDENNGSQAVLTVSCAAAGTSNKTLRFTSTAVAIASNKATFNVDISSMTDAQTGDQCTATVAISGNTARNASGDFKIGFKQIAQDAPPTITSTVTVGEEFRIENLSMFNIGIPFWDLLLRECTATEDPWVFRHHNNTLKRVYPISITSTESLGAPGDVNPNNDNQCLGRYDGFIGGLFTLGSDYAGCKLKLVKEAVVGGDAFTAMGAPQLASATVTANAGKVWLNTGARPTAPAGISSTVSVYISTNRGQTWQESAITGWVTTATDTGISVSSSNPSDNTVNMALIGISNSANTKRWWRMVKGI